MLYFGYTLLFIGGFFILTSFIGMLRFPDFYSKIHAASISDSFGIPISLIGLICITDSYLISIKLFIVLVIYMILSPSSCNSLAKAAWLSKYNKNKKQ
jgi:multicomponent Na+:H+ antiporter subunit G